MCEVAAPKLGSRRMRLCLGFLLVIASGSAAVPEQAQRPPITGISHIAFYVHDVAAADHFYGHILGGIKAADPEDPAGSRYYFGNQFIELLPASRASRPGMLAHVAYSTTDVRGLRAYFLAHHSLPGELRDGSDGSRWFVIRDPEGNDVQFVGGERANRGSHPEAVSSRIIHVGYLVRNRAAED